MKKLLGIMVLGLLWCGTVISAEKNITGFKKIRKSVRFNLFESISATFYNIKEYVDICYNLLKKNGKLIPIYHPN